jgi:hypothetical protein
MLAPVAPESEYESVVDCPALIVVAEAEKPSIVWQGVTLTVVEAVAAAQEALEFVESV